MYTFLVWCQKLSWPHWDSFPHKHCPLFGRHRKWMCRMSERMRTTEQKVVFPYKGWEEEYSSCTHWVPTEQACLCTLCILCLCYTTMYCESQTESCSLQLLYSCLRRKLCLTERRINLPFTPVPETGRPKVQCPTNISGTAFREGGCLAHSHILAPLQIFLERPSINVCWDGDSHDSNTCSPEVGWNHHLLYLFGQLLRRTTSLHSLQIQKQI